MATSPGGGASIGPYRVVRSLGSGGMGEVLLAHDERLDRHVAIKRIRADSRDSPTYRKRLVREARSVARLSHPAVVRVFDILEEDDGDAIVMEYVEGSTLARLLEEGALDAAQLTDVLLQVTDGLQAAHDAGLVHRDLKGENVLVTAVGDAKILDFGIAKSAISPTEDERLTGEGLGLGTIRAMSPEQAEGSDVDARSDLFSLGVLLYEALTGRSPFLARSRISTLTRLVTHDPPPVHELNGSIPLRLSELTAALLEKRPQDRPRSSADVGAVLEVVRDSDTLVRMVIPRLSYRSATSDPEAVSSLDGDSEERRRRSRDRARSRRGTTGDLSVRTGVGRRGVIAVTGVALAVLGLATARLWMSGPPELSAGRIMVFPMVGGTGVAATVGEDVATMIGHALDGAEPLKWVDGWSVLDAAERADIRVLELERAAELARASACAFFVTGRVVVADGSARVFLDLRDSSTGERLHGGDATSAESVPWQAGLGAMSALLPALIPTDVPDLAADFSTVAPDAVARFLRGEAAHRRARVSESLQHFRGAFDLDSTFALAGIRAAQAAAWEHDHAAARDLLEAVLLLPLPAASEAFARGVLAFVNFDAETAVEQLGAALEQDSALTVAWAALGEVYRHRAPREPWPGGPRPFERALAQDSLAGYVLFHRLEELIREGDLARAGPLRERFRRGEPDPQLLEQIDVMYDCVEGGAMSADWTEVARRDGRGAAFAATQLLVGMRQPACAEALYRAVMIADTIVENAEPRYWTGLLGLTGSKLAQRQFDDARLLILTASRGFESFQSLIDRSVVTDGGVRLPTDDGPWSAREVPLRSDWETSLTRWSELAILVSAVYPELVDLGELGAADIRSIGDVSAVPYRTSVWMLGLWAARTGQSQLAASAADRLMAFPGLETEVERAYTQRMGAALEAHRVLAEGDEDGALERLRELTANAREGTIFVELVGSFALERLVLAGLEERLGDSGRALVLLRGFDEPNAVTNAVYLAPALEACARVASRVGRAARAEECRSRRAELGWP